MFVAKDYDSSFGVKLHNYFAARFGRKDLLREFCANNGIDYKPKRGRKYCLPEKYLIEHKEISYLSGVRDKLILSFYDDYRDAQRINTNEQKDLKARIDTENAIIEQLKDTLQSKQKLSFKESIDKLHHKSVVSSLKAKIQNEKREKAMLENRLSVKEAEYKDNLQNWNKQIEIIQKMLEMRRKSFEKQISKKVTAKLNYTGFYSVFDEYPDEVKKVLNGGLYE